MEADGPAGSIDALKSNGSSSSTNSSGDATLYEYVLRPGDDLIVMGKFNKQDDKWYATALPDVPIATSRSFNAYRDDVQASKSTSDKLKLAGFALLGGAVLAIVLSIVRGRRKKKATIAAD
jgi:hypothetical protein